MFDFTSGVSVVPGSRASVSKLFQDEMVNMLFATERPYGQVANEVGYFLTMAQVRCL